MPALALFDFDGTVTAQDTFGRFVFLSISGLRKQVFTRIITPMLWLRRRDYITSAALRRAALQVALIGQSSQRLRALGAHYAATHLPTVVRPDMLERIRWHQVRGDTVVIVSASVDDFLAPWCRQQGVTLLCNQIAMRAGRLLPWFTPYDCAGEGKVQRIRASYDLTQYDRIYAYGDTAEDLPMLLLADEAYYQGKRFL